MDDVMEQLDQETAWMLRVVDGDDHAFQLIMERFQRPILSYIYRWVRDPAEAEELAQEVFLRVYRAKNTYQPGWRFSSWLYTIATNICLQEMRRRRRRFLPWLGKSTSGGDGEDSVPVDVPDQRESVLVQLQAEERESALFSAISGLPKKEKTALLLRKYQELSYKEIAEIMNCGEGAVKTLIHRGKLRLRERLRPFLQDGQAAI